MLRTLYFPVQGCEIETHRALHLTKEINMIRENDILIKRLTLEAFLAGCKRWNALPKEKTGRVYTQSPEKTLCGFVAEEFIHKSLMPKLIPSAGDQVFHYDYLYFGRKMEIKNKCVNSRPSPNFEVSINQYWVPECNDFFFTRMLTTNKNTIIPRSFKMNDTISDQMAVEISPLLLEKYSHIYLLGFIPKAEFLDPKKAFLVNEGDSLGDDSAAKGNTINRYIRDLYPAKKLLDYYAKNK